MHIALAPFTLKAGVSEDALVSATPAQRSALTCAFARCAGAGLEASARLDTVGFGGFDSGRGRTG